jgi:hypothetical protein
MTKAPLKVVSQAQYRLFQAELERLERGEAPMKVQMTADDLRAALAGVDPAPLPKRSRKSSTEAARKRRGAQQRARTEAPSTMRYATKEWSAALGEWLWVLCDKTPDESLPASYSMRLIETEAGVMRWTRGQVDEAE